MDDNIKAGLLDFCLTIQSTQISTYTTRFITKNSAFRTYD